MQVQCIAKNALVETYQRDPIMAIHSPGPHEFPLLEVGAIYRVYAILESRYDTWYLLYIRDYIGFYPAKLFVVKYHAIPKHWITKEHADFWYEDDRLTSYPRLVQDRMHLEGVLDFSKPDEEVFRRECGIVDINSGRVK